MPKKKVPSRARSVKRPPPSLADVIAPPGTPIPEVSMIPMLIDDIELLGPVTNIRTMSLWDFINLPVHPNNRDTNDHAADIDWFMSAPTKEKKPLAPLALAGFAVIELAPDQVLTDADGHPIPHRVFLVNGATRASLLRARFTEHVLRMRQVAVEVFVPRDQEEAEFFPFFLDTYYATKTPADRARMMMKWLGVPHKSTYLRKGARITSALELAGHVNLHERRRPPLHQMKTAMLEWAGEIALADSLWLNSDMFPAATFGGVLVSMRVNPDLTSRLARLVLNPSDKGGTTEAEQRAAAAFTAAMREWKALKKTLGGPLSAKELAGIWVAAFKMATNPESRSKTVKPDDFEAFREEAMRTRRPAS